MKTEETKNLTQNDSLTITEAATLSNVCRQAIYVALRKGRMKGYRIGHQWMIKKEDLQEYRKNLYSRAHSKYNGEYVYQPEKGMISIREAGIIANMDYLKLYYYVNLGRLKAFRKGCAWVINRSDLEEFVEKYFNTRRLKA